MVASRPDRRIRWSIPILTVTVAAALTAAAAAQPAYAAGLSEVTSFGANPGNLLMYEYIPAALPTHPAVVVALHGCTQTAGDYYADSGWPKYADRYGTVLVFPQQQPSNNINRCFNWFQPGDITRGQGEAASIRRMVQNAVAVHAADPARVFVTGLSAGGAMTSALLAAYPDVFAAGAVIGGIPYGCARDLISAFGCMNPGVDRTPGQWAQAVHAADPGYGGPYPRVAIWHGTADMTVAPANATESRDEWTAVQGLPVTPTSTSTLNGSGHGQTTVETYADSSGRALVQVYRVQGMGHGTPVDPGSSDAECGAPAAYFLDFICSSYYTAQFWGTTDRP